jgi:hypothetical protein
MSGDFDLTTIVLLGGAVATFAKLVVDMAKMSGLKDTRWYPVLAFVVAWLVAFGLLYRHAGGIVGVNEGITSFLAGLLAAAGAVGITETGRKADAVKDARQGE